MIQHNIGQAYHDISTILLDTDKSVAERGGDITNYVTKTLQPILDKVLEIATATKESAEQKAREAEQYGEEKAGDAGVDVDGVKRNVKGKVDDVKEVRQAHAVACRCSSLWLTFRGRLPPFTADQGRRKGLGQGQGPAGPRLRPG